MQLAEGDELGSNILHQCAPSSKTLKTPHRERRLLEAALWVRIPLSPPNHKFQRSVNHDPNQAPGLHVVRL